MDIIQTVTNVYSNRADWSHKGSLGKLLIIAGSEKYTGSPIFNAMSALKAGCDLVTLITPRRVADIAVAAWPDIITVPLEGAFLNLSHITTVLPLLKTHDALLIGGGLGREKETQLAIGNIVSSCQLPLIIDADGLRALSGHLDLLRGKKAILTPHADEFRDISGMQVADTKEDRRFKAFQFAKEQGVSVVLKGHVDIITDGVEVYENETGSVYMTKGGFGDTLAGIAGALLARKATPYEAGCAAAYLNGLTGERIAREKKEGMLASDIFDYLPTEISKVLGDEPAIMDNVVVLQKALVRNKKGQILALHRPKLTPERGGKWDVPGGRLEKGEMASEGLTREIREETGLTDIECTPFTVEVTYIEEKKRTWVIIGYYGSISGKTPSVILSQEHDQFRWVTKAEFLALESSDYLQQFITALKF